MPVDSMSMRALIGIVQALLTPGIRNARSISAISPSTLTPLRHSPSGFRLITVSTISVGAGSVAVAARPACRPVLALDGRRAEREVRVPAPLEEPSPPLGRRD